MTKDPKTEPGMLHTQTKPAHFVPSPTQLDTLARRFMPEIKKFFADEQVQREFATWLESQKIMNK